MPEEKISIFRQELERVKEQFEKKFQDIMASVRADRENDKRTLQMVNENINNDRKAINQNRALNDKLETLLNVQNTMLSELRSMNNSIKDLSGGGGGSMGGILAAGGAAAAAGAGLTAAGFFGGNRDTNVDGGLRDTRGGGDDYPNPTRRITGDGPGAARDGDNLFSFISKGEGGYSASNRGTIGNRIVGSTQNTTRDNKRLEDMTFREIMELQNIRNPNDPNRLFAVGAYQIIPSTLAEIFPHSGLDPDEKFTPENQDRLAELLLLGNPETGYTKRPNLAAYLRGESDDIEAAMLDFAKEWASAPDPRTGKSYYGSGNRASHSVEEMRNALLDARRNFEETGSIIPQPQEEEASAERVEGDGVTELLNKFNIDPNSLRFDEEGRLKNELYDTEGYPIRLSPKDAEELSQGLGIELPSTMEELRSDLASRDVAVEYEDRFSPGTPTRSNTQKLIRRSNETIRKYYAERLGLPEDISMKEIREYMLENDISSAPALKSVMIGRGGVEDIGGMFRDLEYVGSRVQPASGPHRTVSGRPAEHMDYSQGLLAAKLTEGSPLTEYLARRETLDGGGGDDIIDGGDGRDTLDPQDTPLGPRIPEETPTEPSEENPTAPTGFPTLFEQFERGESPTSMTGMGLAPAVEDALRPNLPEPPTEEDPEETTSGGYTGGGGGSREQEQPQIESNAIGRFPWAEKIIKYYNLSDMIKTNMLS